MGSGALGAEPVTEQDERLHRIFWQAQLPTSVPKLERETSAWEGRRTGHGFDEK